MHPGYVNSDPETTPNLPVSLANLITCWVFEKKKKPNPNPKETHSMIKESWNQGSWTECQRLI